MDDVEDLDDPSGSILQALDDRDVALWAGVGISLPHEWIHRRVETVTFVDERTVRRRVSIDFTVGLHSPQFRVGQDGTRLVPLALLEKRMLTSLDVQDDAGRTLPVLTTAQNGRLAGAVLCSLAESLSGGDISAIRDDLLNVAARPPAEAEQARQRVQTSLVGQPEGSPIASLATSGVFAEFLQNFTRNFILATLLHAEIGERRIVKFSYLSPIEEVPLARRTRLAAAMGWQPREYGIALQGLVFCNSYHVELEVPEGVSINGAVLFERGVADTQPDEIPDDHLGAFSRAGSRSVHFHASVQGNENAEVRLWLRIAREGWLRAAAMATLGVAAVTTGNALFVHRLFRTGGAVPTTSSDVAALLMGLVALLASYAVRVGEHPVTARAVFGVRLFTVLSVGTPLAAGWTLAFGVSGTTLQVVWWLLAGVAAAIAVVASAAWIGPTPVTPLP